MRFLHYFHSSIPSTGTEKAPGLQMQPLQTCASRLALRLELCMARTQDVSQRGQTIINVALLHFLHYFSLLHPIFPAQKNAGASNAAAPNMRTARLCLATELSLAISSPRAFQPPQTGCHARSFYCTFCIISIPSSHLPAQKSAGASNAVAPNIRIARLCLAAELSLAMTDLRAFQPPRTGYHARLFIASSALFPLLHPILPAQKNAKASNAAAPNMRHARAALPCGLS
ncbi:MAG TPA: hypothetical protein IAB20_03600 [Candidatus Pullichristensenella excrementipullorum]|nr:hypothetical protein [Candidatus Pullichristensenella excrementipullorum]